MSRRLQPNKPRWRSPAVRLRATAPLVRAPGQLWLPDLQPAPPRVRSLEPPAAQGQQIDLEDYLATLPPRDGDKHK